MKVGVLGEAMRRAGVKRPEMAQDRLRNLALDALKKPDSEAAFVRALEDDPEATLCLFTVDEIIAHARRYIGALSREQEMRGRKGLSTCADDQPGVTPPSAHATKPVKVAKHNRHLPGHAPQRDPAALRAVSSAVAKSVLDSFRVRNGKAIGDCTPVELRALASQNLREGFLCRLVLNTARLTPANDGQPLRQWCDEDTLKRCIQQAAAHEDLYVSAA